MPTLHVLSGNLNSTVFEVTDDRTTIGRDPSSSIVLDHTTVSKNHAMLVKNGSGYKLLDFHSTNGTQVNGQRIVVTALQHGDRLRFGDVEIRYEISSARPPKPNPEPAPASPVQVLGASARTEAVAPAVHATAAVLESRPLPGKIEAKNFDAGTIQLKVTPGRPVEPVIVPAVPTPMPPKAAWGKKRFALAASCALGLLVLFVGYAIQARSLTFLGLLMATTSFLCLFFDLKFGSVVAPPREKH